MLANWEFAFRQISTTFSQQMFQIEFIGGVVVKTMQISNFNQSDIIFFFEIIRSEVVV